MLQTSLSQYESLNRSLGSHTCVCTETPAAGGRGFRRGRAACFHLPGVTRPTGREAWLQDRKDLAGFPGSLCCAGCLASEAVAVREQIHFQVPQAGLGSGVGGAERRPEISESLSGGSRDFNMSRGDSCEAAGSPHYTPNTRPGPGPAWHRRPLVPAARPRSPRPGLGSPHPRGTPGQPGDTPSGPDLRVFGAGERVRREKASGGGGRHSWEGYLTSHRGRRCVCTSVRHSQGKTLLLPKGFANAARKKLLSFYIADILGSREDGAPLC